jgi:colanic acid biosynthesis glycosyl transferase WcaI
LTEIKTNYKEEIMRILIFGANYEPDLGPSAPLFTMLCENLVKLGHQVTMITMVPHYPSGRVSNEFRGKLVWRSVENGVNVVRVTLPSVNRSRILPRLLQFVVYQIGATLIGLGKKYEVAFVASSSLSVWLPFAMLCVFRCKPAIYSVYDVYPDVGIKLGIFRHKTVISLVSAMEKYCLKNSSFVRIISNSFRPALRALDVPDEKMVLIYDWVDTDLIQPLSRSNEFAKEFNLTEKFVIMYAGNIGLSQGLEYVLTAAETLKDHCDIHFVFVGDGANRENLLAQAEIGGLTNVQFIPFQSRDRLPEVLASADVSLVTLKRGIGLDALPSKTFSILASGRPVLVSADEQSEVCNLIKKADAGICIPPESPALLTNKILELKNDKKLYQRFGTNGRSWAINNHAPLVGAKQIEQLLMRAVCRKGE